MKYLVSLWVHLSFCSAIYFKSYCACVSEFVYVCRERDRLLQIVVSRIFFYILIEVPKQILNHTFLGLSYFKAWERCFVRTCCDLTQAIFIGIPFFFFSIVFQVNKLYFIKHEIINLVRFFFFAVTVVILVIFNNHTY